MRTNELDKSLIKNCKRNFGMENEEELLKNCAFGTQAVKGTKVEYPVPSLAIPIFATSTYVLDSASHGASNQFFQYLNTKTTNTNKKYQNISQHILINIINRTNKS